MDTDTCPSSLKPTTTHNTTTPDFCGVREIAAVLGTSQKSVYRLVRGKKIPFDKLGGKLLFDPALVRAHIRRKMARSVETPTTARDLEIDEFLERVIAR